MLIIQIKTPEEINHFLYFNRALESKYKVGDVEAREGIKRPLETPLSDSDEIVPIDIRLDENFFLRSALPASTTDSPDYATTQKLRDTDSGETEEVENQATSQEGNDEEDPTYQGSAPVATYQDTTDVNDQPQVASSPQPKEVPNATKTESKKKRKWPPHQRVRSLVYNPIRGGIYRVQSVEESRGVPSRGSSYFHYTTSYRGVPSRESSYFHYTTSYWPK